MTVNEVPASTVESLADAARAAVMDRRLALTRDPQSVRSVTVELELDRKGRLCGANAFVQRHLSTNQALGLRR